MKTNQIFFATLLFSLAGTAHAATDSLAEPETQSAPTNKTQAATQSDPEGWKISLYPLLIWAPIMGADVRVPGNGNPGGDAKSDLTGAYMFGIGIKKDKWVMNANGLWAELTAERDARPTLKIGADIIYGDLMVGHQIFKDFYLNGGVRRLSLTYDIKAGELPNFNRKIGVWDPMVGLAWHHQLNKKWSLHANAEGGGFGAGSDVDLSAAARAEWRFAKHVGTTFGFNVLHFQITEENALGKFTAKQTVYGPVIGLGIYF